MLSRCTTGMKISTSTTATTQNSTRRLRGSGWVIHGRMVQAAGQPAQAVSSTYQRYPGHGGR